MAILSPGFYYYGDAGKETAWEEDLEDWNTVVGSSFVSHQVSEKQPRERWTLRNGILPAMLVHKGVTVVSEDTIQCEQESPTETQVDERPLSSSQQAVATLHYCYSHAFRETNSLRRTVQMMECSLLHRRAQGRVSS